MQAVKYGKSASARLLSGEKPGKGQEVCLQLCGVADKKWFLARKSKFFENAHFFMFQKEESCDIIRMHLYTRPSKSTITAEEWRMMWKCPVCRYENKITRFCLRCGYNGDHGQSPDAPAAGGRWWGPGRCTGRPRYTGPHIRPGPPAGRRRCSPPRRRCPTVGTGGPGPPHP